MEEDELTARTERLALELERRSHFRVETSLVVHYLVTETGEMGTGVISNIGLAGARIDFPREIKFPCSLLLIFEDFNGKVAVPGFEIPAQLVWTVADKAEGPFPGGLAFIDLSAEVRQSLLLLLAAILD